jgi:hypothetical protein
MVSERGCVRILAHDPNRHLFDSRQRMKQTAINNGRGSPVRYVALRQAVTSGAIAESRIRRMSERQLSIY